MNSCSVPVIGGRGVDNTFTVPTHEVLDPATGQWTERAPLPLARDHMALVAVDGKLHAIGGRLTNPAIRPVGIAVNTQALGEAEARGCLDAIAADYHLPAVDPVRFGVGEIVDRIAQEFPDSVPSNSTARRLSA